MDSVELIINSELKCLEQWLEAIKITADKTMFLPFSYNKNKHFPPTKIGNITIIGETSLYVLGIHLDKRLNFKNHVTKVSLKM